MMIRAAVLFVLSMTAGAAQTNPPAAPSVFGVFVGSSPCDLSVRRLLQIPPEITAELIEWKVTLFKEGAAGAPASYELRYKYGLTVAGKPGLGPAVEERERRGTWRMTRGTKAQPEAVVYELNGTLSLLKVSDTVLHLLNGDRSLMIGNGGWSYTLNRSDAAETRADPLFGVGPGQPRTLSPSSTGPSVLGIFEGRTPCQGVARELNLALQGGCAKVKWRVTLYQDPGTRQATTYKVESTLHRSGAREGSWTIVRDARLAPSTVIYRLAPAGKEAALFLLRGDDNVLFFMDQNQRPLTGHAEFSYTLDRRQSSVPR